MNLNVNSAMEAGRKRPEGSLTVKMQKSEAICSFISHCEEENLKVAPVVENLIAQYLAALKAVEK
jgi:hypothetical protein